MVSSNVNPVNTRMVSCFSFAVSVPHDGRSLDTGTFSGSQKLPVSRSQTSASFSSCTRFQLIAEARSISFIPSLTRTPLHLPVYLQLPRPQTLPLGADKHGQHKNLCFACRESAAAYDVTPGSVASRISRAVCSGWSQCGKWPQSSNQWSTA